MWNMQVTEPPAEYGSECALYEYEFATWAEVVEKMGTFDGLAVEYVIWRDED